MFDINTEGFHRTLIEVSYAPNAYQFSCEYNFLAVNRPMFTIYTVEYFLQVILSVYRFKGIIFVLKTNMHTKWTTSVLDLRSWLCDVRQVERLGPLPPDIHTEDNGSD